MNNLPDCKVNSLLTCSLEHFGFSEYEETFGSNDPDCGYLLARAKLVDYFGFDMTGIRLSALENLSEPECEKLLTYLNERIVTFHPVIDSHNFSAMTAQEANTFADNYINSLTKNDKFYRNKTITCNLNSGTRFDQDVELEEKLETIANNIAPLVKNCLSAGYRFAIENAGDFYCSEIVRICQSVPGAMMVYDTGNTYLIGEDSLQALYTAAPYTIVVHFRDVKVCPDPRNQIIRLQYAPLGEGDVDLEKSLEIIMANSPDPLSLIFETEINRHDKLSVWESLEKEIKYINAIQV